MSKYLFSFLILVLGIKTTKVKKKRKMKEVINDVVKKEIAKN